MADVQRPGFHIHSVPAQPAHFRAAQTIDDTEHQYRFQGVALEQLKKVLQLLRGASRGPGVSLFGRQLGLDRGVKNNLPQVDRIIEALVNVGMVLADCVGGKARFQLFIVIALDESWGNVLEFHAVKRLVLGDVSIKG